MGKQQMITLKDKFKKRLSAYRRHTKEIFGLLTNVTDAVSEFLDEETKHFLQWKGVEREGKFVFIIGITAYPVGHKLYMNDGEIVEITEINKQALQRIIRVGIPLELAENGTLEEVKQFIKIKAEENSPEEEELKIQTPMEALFDQLNKEEEENKEEEADPIQGFESKELSKEQITQIMHHASQSKGKVN
jgi:hypothetical protein